MSGFLTKPLGAALTIAIAVLGAAVAGAVLFTSSRATEVNLTTAQLVPADAGFYFALNTDLSSEQWISTFNLIKKLGNEDPEGELREGAEESGVDWENDVAPFLGGNAAVYVRGIDLMNFDFSGAVIFRAKNAGRVMQVLEDQAGVWDEHTYSGVEYLELGLMGYAARLDEHVVIAYDEASLFEVIDVHTGKTPSLAGVEDFQRLRDELTKNFLGFMYMSSENMLGDFWLDDPLIRAALEESGTSDLVLKPAAWVLGANKAGFEFQAASIGDAGVVSPMLAPRQSRFASLVPGTTAVFFSTTGLAQTWEAVVDQARDQIDDAIAEGSEGEYRSLDEALREAGSELGVDSVEDVIRLFRGELAVTLWFPTGDEDEPEGALLAEVNEAEARPILEAIVRKNSVGQPETRQVGGVEMTVAMDDEGEPLAYAFKEDYVVIGTVAGVEAVLLLGNEPPLSALNRYRETVDAMPTGLGSFMYLNMSTVLSLATGGVLPELDDAEKAMQGLILNVVDERGVVRASGVLTIGD
jgi:hypothetical protein